ncbi:MAG: DUF3109 family protein [Bacteroidales bacterium]|nr:DUF3109 family protein [Bacteroidales bacterium]MDY2916696.1 DUF3109 family protein [Muribaculaceae bacterium]
MLQIQDTLVSLDLIERYFCCDLDACRGACCIEGDAGAPVTEEECEQIRRALPAIQDDLLPAAREALSEGDVAYIDEEGDLVTTIVHGANCAFSCYSADGTCICALEKACREGRTAFLKPESCHLYPVRLRQVGDLTAVNYHRWKICKPAEVKGRRLGLRAYQFLKEPLIARFGQDWYDELCLTAQEYLRQYPAD